MSKPKRIQLRRTKGWRKPEGAVVVSRPSKWGNPFSQPTPEGNVELFRLWITGESLSATTLRGELHELSGHDLCCWCKLCDEHADGKPHDVDCPDCKPCHVDVLLELASYGRISNGPTNHSR